MEFSIRPKGPFNLDLTLQRYRLFGDDAAHAFVDGVYHRVIAIDGKLWVYSLREGGAVQESVLQVQILGGRAQARHRSAVATEIQHSLSLDVELEPFYRWAADDPVLAELIARCPRLRAVANIAVGYNNIDLAACTARGILATNTPGVLDDSTADLAWALMLGAARRLTELERRVRAGEWKGWRLKQWLGVDVHHATLGIEWMQ